MRTYSPFFQTLYDQPEPVGYLGKGTHYSVLRATVFHDALGDPLPDAVHHDFAVVWDEDHDVRVIAVIERLYRAGMLAGFDMFGERKAMLTAVVSDKFRDPALISNTKLSIQGVAATGLDDDVWKTTICGVNDNRIPIIDADIEKVRLYLSNIHMLWQLGSHSIA